ncbi:Protein of unknown function [Pyronema omphalodes CBS 100304]|uniref:Secreted protein n=1 Tax=Pyronema omphalodes (strain CBS 100304) TaxID=1076935 RepID=U4LD49_PYROM|nr:Protein of unknown function [Pyronema omphalodes CBS 100304]
MVSIFFVLLTRLLLLFPFGPNFQCICGRDAIDVWALGLLWRSYWLTVHQLGFRYSCVFDAASLLSVAEDGDWYRKLCSSLFTFLCYSFNTAS